MRSRYRENAVPAISRLAAAPAVRLALFSCVLGPVLHAQAAGDHTEQSHKAATFEVVSIRPTDPDSQGLTEGGWDGNTFYMRNLPLSGVVGPAFYDRGMVPPGFIASLPQWVREEKFDITAKVPGPMYEALQRQTGDPHPNVPWDLRHQMLQQMLSERCNLAVHHTQTVLHGYSLEVARPGINPKRMKIWTTSEAIPSDAISGGGTWLTASTKPTDGRNAVRTFYKMTMSEFASHLTTSTVVHDNTRLTDRYDFSVELIDGGLNVSERFDVTPLGLRFTKMDTVADAIVVDHMDRPSSN